MVVYISICKVACTCIHLYMQMKINIYICIYIIYIYHVVDVLQITEVSSDHLMPIP